MKTKIAALAAALLLLVAAKPVAAATNTIALNTASPHLGGIVTFTVTVDHKYDCTRKGCARVLVECYQGSVEVYGEGGDIEQARGSGLSPLGYSGFLLGGASSLWLASGGPADCTATLFRFDNSGPVQTYVEFASTTFSAGG